ncbi:LLM class flavin-dependent oxidoreductase [Paeniroseomonas aquatica]|uniref:LLM class flavin-dependent oxidoreductase n=1 Tax=Paeniroseomonas aquatica TaxID=373043 RepID=UPI00361C6429
MGVGKPLKSILHMNPDIPIYLGTENEATVKLTAEIADGWLALGFVPGCLPEYLPWLEEGFRRAGHGKSRADFTIQASAHVEVAEDVGAALARLKPEVALYVGGMGHRDKNFHKDMMTRRGFGEAANRVQELYLAGRKDEAAAAVPDEWVDAKALVGPRPDPGAVPRLGGFRGGCPDRAVPPARGDRGHGRGGAAEPGLSVGCRAPAGGRGRPAAMLTCHIIYWFLRLGF